MEEILKFLDTAVSEGKLEQSKVDEFKTNIESRKFTQEDLNKHIADRAKREEDKYKPQVEELTALKEKLGDKTVDDLLAQTEELLVYKQKEKEGEIDSKIESLLSNKSLPKAYRKQIEFSEDEEVLKANVEAVENQFKEDLKEAGISNIGGATSPSGGAIEIDYNDSYSLLYEGFKENANE
ncbi:hypothetical protein KK120_18645 [Virgibacillus dakarensis]|nr:hypothetical protein [Virgibacillus dakarensis]